MPREYTPAMDCTTSERPPIAMQAVNSSQIKAIGYDHATHTLAVSFTRGQGHIYHYPEVAPETACAFFMAPSLGAHFGQHISKLPSLKYSADVEATA